MKQSTLRNIVKGSLFLGLATLGSYKLATIQPATTESKVVKTELIISAAASMKDVLEAIAPVYERANPHIKLVYNFASSGTLQHQIERGAPVDIFISAAAKQMNYLAAKNLLLSETRQDLLKNQMVLVVPKNAAKIDDFNDLKNGSIDRIALGEPKSVPAGKYASEILTALNLSNAVKSKTVYGKDVRQVLNYVATGNTDAGIVYQTDAKTSDRVKVVATAPEPTHSPVVYPVAVIKDSKNIKAAKKLMEFLFTPEAQAVFKQYGFTPLSR
ncbi:molybdate ABC transporter substrate-binding protein [Myxosarcina sp. GI1]|uniref:molybdate ABC transporter substrate-binding protein n=1 Tax=Myxosarcina sp. GI1 TaxID=1541065 RepID=UPI00056D4295|nr:molybdate ABC transporter substrate-binding protein [Myxosarcina sp. GI1]